MEEAAGAPVTVRSVNWRQDVKSPSRAGAPSRRVAMVVAVWGLVTVIAAGLHIWFHTNDPGAVGYERDWDFQLVMFALTRLPFLAGCLVGALLWAHRAAKST